ncbi:hypothetical protein B0T21DRAFT_279959 [Apiosordaria backusii]|uniref:Uncharacterized protein n=1 Tax=Apiosordaria backusii TaxID=314023 RepID=A0AA40ESV3_9PEZI|nr:hypothetical protein B0T21DRAFT_279959 [Apiosordaria backusii]
MSVIETSDNFAFPSQNSFHTPGNGIHVDERWTQYADRISQRQKPGEYDEISLSLWQVARGDCLDKAIIESYLQLLRDRYSTIEIAEPRELGSDFEQLGAKTSGKTTVLPIEDGGQWLFAVAYPDYVHWFDSRPNSTVPQCLIPSGGNNFPSWTGPKQTRSEDSGLFMLLGIRLLAEGATHLSQQEADVAIPRFRSITLVELLSMTLDPGDGDFEDLTLVVSAPVGPPKRAAGTAVVPFAVPPVSSPQSLPRAVSARSILPSDRKTILTVLSSAVAASRSTKMTRATALAILWSSIKSGTVVSEFHKRYNGILFYEKMEQIKGINPLLLERDYNIDCSTLKEMRSLQPKFRFWRDLCRLHPDQGWAKYTLLCAIPEGYRVPNGRNLQDAKISEIQLRLSNENDTLQRDLARAKNLCEAILRSSLPAEHLMIDFYLFRAGEPLTDESYNAYLSLDPHERIRIPRQSI